MGRANTSQAPGPRPFALVAAGLAAGVMAMALRPRRFTFRDRVVIITGGSRGLGLALARELARERPQLVLVARHQDQLGRAVTDLAARGVRADTAVCDIRDAGQVNALVRQVVTRHGRIDVLINNAGVIQAMPFEHATRADFEDSLNTHFWGPLHLVQACMPSLRRSKGARIANIASIGGRIGVPHLSTYCAGKFALVGLSETLRAELQKDGISVTTVTPGLMRTGSYRNVVVRGQHRREAQTFALVSTSPVTTMNVERAARQIVEAIRDGRAHCTPGVQARVGEVANALAPGLVAAAMAFVATHLLPGPAPRGDQPTRAAAIDLGWLEHVLPHSTLRRLNQTLPTPR